VAGTAANPLCYSVRKNNLRISSRGYEFKPIVTPGFPRRRTHSEKKLACVKRLFEPTLPGRGKKFIRALLSAEEESKRWGDYNRPTPNAGGCRGRFIKKAGELIDKGKG